MSAAQLFKQRIEGLERRLQRVDANAASLSAEKQAALRKVWEKRLNKAQWRLALHLARKDADELQNSSAWQDNDIGTHRAAYEAERVYGELLDEGKRKGYIAQPASSRGVALQPASQSQGVRGTKRQVLTQESINKRRR